MPFAAAQIGLGFRNEIAPRNGLLRVREFTMAEIEHFVNPGNVTDPIDAKKAKNHPKFTTIQSKKLVLFPATAQLTTGRTICLTLQEAVYGTVADPTGGLINNETLAYFMGRTQLWCEKIGIQPARMRFRQHLPTEMSHYATDCWDLEIHFASYGWIECVGHADRACYDLTQHANRTGIALTASERLPQPITVERLVIEANKKLIGPIFKGKQKDVITMIESLTEDEIASLQTAFNTATDADKAVEVKGFALTKDLVSISKQKKTMVETKYTPSVIEPSFGIGRILYALLEHAFSQRLGLDEARGVMAFKPCVAPIKVGLFRLINHSPFDIIIEDVKQALLAKNIAVRVDSSSGTVGRRYSRADELGIPFGVTVDFQTLLDGTVTVRDRDSMAQVRVSQANLLPLLVSLVEESVTWDVVMTRFMVVKTGLEGEEEDEEEGEGADAAKSASASATAAPTAAATAQVVAPTVVQYTARGSFSRPNVK